MPIGAGSVGVSARPILPKTLNTSGSSENVRSQPRPLPLGERQAQVQQRRESLAGRQVLAA